MVSWSTIGMVMSSGYWSSCTLSCASCIRDWSAWSSELLLFALPSGWHSYAFNVSKREIWSNCPHYRMMQWEHDASRTCRTHWVCWLFLKMTVQLQPPAIGGFAHTTISSYDLFSHRWGEGQCGDYPIVLDSARVRSADQLWSWPLRPCQKMINSNCFPFYDSHCPSILQHLWVCYLTGYIYSPLVMQCCYQSCLLQMSFFISFMGGMDSFGTFMRLVCPSIVISFMQQFNQLGSI